MLRREVLSSLGLASLAPLTKFINGNKEKSYQFLIDIKLDVGSLSPTKAKTYIEKVRKQLLEEKPESFHFLIHPTRTEYTEISIYALAGEKWIGNSNEVKYEKWLENLQIDRLVQINREFSIANRKVVIGDQKYEDYVKMQVHKIYRYSSDEGPPKNFDKYFDYAYELGTKYRVADLHKFIFEFIQSHYDVNERLFAGLIEIEESV